MGYVCSPPLLRLGLLISSARPMVIRIPTVRAVVAFSPTTLSDVRSSPESFANPRPGCYYFYSSLQGELCRRRPLLGLLLPVVALYCSSSFALRASHPYPHLETGRAPFRPLEPGHGCLDDDAALPICSTISNLTVVWSRN